MQLRYTILFVTDLERSRRFYHELLGMPIRSEDASSIELDTGETTLALHRAHVGKAGHHPMMAAGSVRIGFYVDNLDTVHQRLIDAGVRCVTQPERRFDMLMGLYEDSDGIYFTLGDSADAPLRG